MKIGVKTSLLVASVLLICSSFIGCGGGSSGEGDPPKNSNSATDNTWDSMEWDKGQWD